MVLPVSIAIWIGRIIYSLNKCSKTPGSRMLISFVGFELRNDDIESVSLLDLKPLLDLMFAI